MILHLCSRSLVKLIAARNMERNESYPGGSRGVPAAADATTVTSLAHPDAF